MGEISFGNEIGTSGNQETAHDEKRVRIEEGNGSGGYSGASSETGNTGKKSANKRTRKSAEGENKFSEVAVRLDTPDEVPVIVPGGNETNEQSTKKKKSTRKKKKSTVDPLQVATLITSISSIVATRIGEHWRLTDEEAHAIAEPLTNIMERHGIIEKVGEYGDYISLTSALVVTILPRVMLTMELRKQNKPSVVKGAVPNAGNQNSDAKNESGKGEFGHLRILGTNSGSPVVPSDVKRTVSELVQPF